MSDQNAENKAEKSTSGKAKIGRLRSLFKFLKPYKLMALGAAVALIIAAGSTLMIFKSMQLIIDQGFVKNDPSAIDQYFAGLFIVVVVLAISTFFRFMLVTTLGERVVADIRKAVYANLIRLHPSFFEENRPGELSARLTADTAIIQSVLGSSLSVALRNALMLMGGTVMLFLISPKLLGMIALVLPLVVAPIIILGRQVRALSKSSQDKIADVGTMADESLGAIQVVQAFTREEEEKNKFSGAVESAYGVARRRIKKRAWMTGLVILLIFGAIDLVLWRGAKDVVVGAMSSGELASFVGLSILVAGAMGALSEIYGELMRAAGAAERLSHLMGQETNLVVPENPRAIENEGLKGAVQFDHIVFSYPSKPNETALNDFSLDVQPGESVALVGPSGAGKSTVLQLIMRFFDPQSGAVRLDGIDIRDFDPTDFRQHMSIVPQETVIFADTVLENVRYGRPEARDDEVMAAIASAYATDFIERLPDGINTYLGERGVRLSGGQRQRLAIARAILRDAPILLLDEATSALDSESEMKVQMALDNLMKGRTTIVIAHRLSTVRNADRIIVMEEGRVAEEGKHDVLMEKGGLYARLADLQFQNQSLD